MDGGLLGPGGHAGPLEVLHGQHIVGRRGLDGLLEILRGPGGLALEQEHVAQVVQGLGLVAAVAEGFQGLALAAQAHQGQAHVVVRALVPAAALDRGAQLDQGLLRLAQGQPGHAQVVAHLGAGGVHGQGRLIVAHGLGVLAPAAEEHAQGVLGLPAARVARHGLAQVQLGLAVQPALEEEQPGALVGPGVFRVLGQRGLKLLERGLVQTADDQDRALLDPVVRVLGVLGQGAVVGDQGQLGLAPLQVGVALAGLLLGREVARFLLGRQHVLEPAASGGRVGRTAGQKPQAKDEQQIRAHDRSPSPDQWLIRAKISTSLSPAGPMMATNRAGRMQRMSGMRSFTGSFAAFSSARW